MIPPRPARLRIRRVLTVTKFMLVAVAVLALGSLAAVLIDARLAQYRESRALERARAAVEQKPAPVAPAPEADASHAVPPAIAEPGSAIGRLEISRLGVSVMVLEGDDPTTLRRGAGHIPGTALPGGSGNFAVAAHRDTFFRPLRNIQPRDVVTLTTAGGSYKYVVESIRIVGPDAVDVLDPSAKPLLTLVTCYPFNYIGAAPKRFIVQASGITD